MDNNDSFLPYQELKRRIKLPVELYEFQQKATNELGPLPRLGLYFDVGCGKTYTAIHIAMYKMLFASIEKTVVIMPPVLLQNWKRNIEKFPGTDVLVYAGTPAQRKKMKFDKQFILVGIQMFKRDFKRFEAELGHCRLFVVVDEAQALKNPGSDNFKFVRDFSLINDLCLLTGTPLSVPEDGYAYIKLLTPEVYKSQYQFESIHVTERDFRTNKPKAYAHLDMLNRNLLLVAHRVLKEDVLKDLPELTYTPIYYDLEPEHLKLYNRMVDEQMVKLTNGGKIDLTNVSALYQALQQVPCNAEYFSEGRTRSTVFDLIDAVMDELAGKKLVIFCHYRRTTTQLLEYLKAFNAVALFGGTAGTQRQKNIDTFVEDPKCKVIILQHKSGGAGIDNLQDVCSDVLMVEHPYRASDLHQAVARVHRDGQKNAVNVRIAVAQRTLQVRLWEFLQENDSLINTVIRGSHDIRAALEGR